MKRPRGNRVGISTRRGSGGFQRKEPRQQIKGGKCGHMSCLWSSVLVVKRTFLFGLQGFSCTKSAVVWSSPVEWSPGSSSEGQRASPITPKGPAQLLPNKATYFNSVPLKQSPECSGAAFKHQGRAVPHSPPLTPHPLLPGAPSSNAILILPHPSQLYIHGMQFEKTNESLKRTAIPWR